MKTLKINDLTHKRLNFYKTEKGFKSFDEAIEYLLKFRASFRDIDRKGFKFDDK